MSEQHLTTTKFSSFDLPPEVLQGVEESGFSYCTPIQAASLPFALQGKDIAGQAQTGTGKTAAFLLAAYVHLIKNPAAEARQKNQPRCIILAPTRELAVQIHKDAEMLGKYTGLKHVAVYGGTGYDTQKQALVDGVDLLIGTPGRVIDYFKQGVFDLKQLQVLILDEADRMFDLGFVDDIRYLIRRMPAPDKRLSMLFSATLSHRVNELAYEHMNDPEEVIIKSENVTADRVRQEVYYPAMDEKIPLLLGLLSNRDDSKIVVFINTKRVAEKINAYFQTNNINGAMLSGDVPQNKRLRIMEDFTAGKTRVLVATDVAARGLHVDDVSLVINFDLPNDAEDYVHRIGRTGRAGASGVAINFACEDYAMSLPDIEQYIGHKISVSKITNELLVTPKAPARIERKKKLHDRKSAQKANPQHKTGTPHHHKKKKATKQNGKKQHENKQHAKPHSHRNQDIKAKPTSDNGMTKKSAGLSKQIQPVKPGLIKTFLNKLISGF
ncbi:MAG: ATP-dependent RNA helicase RhlB [Gammaproteobacteria bacterium]|nr:ATP-dependent RNA helicase RhlB [Gammaproteobacteria bacterium]